MDDLAQLLRQVRRIEIRTKQAMNTLTAGSYRSRFKGQGMEFEEVREYVPGDDVRLIDWNVSARAQNPYIKVFKEERDLTVLVLVDCSSSMHFGARGSHKLREKMTAAAEAAAIIGITAMNNNDSIGMIAFSDQTHVHIPPRRGRNHVTRMIREVLSPQQTGNRTSLCHAAEETMRAVKKKSVCFLISDFLHKEDEFPAALQRLARRHDVIGLRISDPDEEALPKSFAPLPIIDLENGQRRIIASTAKNRRLYKQAWEDQRAWGESTFRKAKSDLINIRSTDDTIAVIQRFFMARRRHA